MECALTLCGSGEKSLPENIQVGVIWQFDIVLACHHRYEIIVGGVWGLAWTAHDRQHRTEALETYLILVRDFRGS